MKHFIAVAKQSKEYSFNVPVVFLRSAKHYVAYSPALELYSQGDDLREARKMFQEAAELFIEGLIEKGTLSEVLEELGWSKVRGRWKQPHELVAQGTQRVRVRA